MLLLNRYLQRLCNRLKFQSSNRYNRFSPSNNGKIIVYVCVSVGSHPRGSSPRGSSPRGSSPRGSSLGGGGYSGWSWAQFLSGALVFALYYLTSSREIIPEVQFPFFLQHVLYKGEVRIVMYIMYDNNNNNNNNKSVQTKHS